MGWGGGGGGGSGYYGYRAIKLWNSLPNNVRESTSLNTFKQSLKTWLFNA